MKKAERQLLVQERRRIRGTKVRSEGSRAKLGPFALWGRILGISGPLILILVVLASFFTPMLAVQSITITGNDRIASSEIETALSSLYDRPMTTISESEVAELLGDFSLIETFTFQAEPPNTLRLTIRERQPLLVLVRSGMNYLYDAAGVQIAQTDEIGLYPFFAFTGNPVGNPTYETAVELLLSLPLSTYQQIFSVEVSQALTIKLVLRDSNLGVFWGSTDQALLKAKVLDSLIATGLDRALTVDVSSPNSPVVQYPDS